MPTEAQDLAETVSSWLQYKSLTGFRSLLNEASLTLPIAEFLMSRHGAKVSAEENHPKLISESKKGRQAQLDFVRKKRNDLTWHEVFECKFNAENIYHIVSDLCRLCILSQAPKIGNPRRRFVYAAKLESDGTTPLDKKLRSGGSLISRFDGILLRSMKNVGESIRVSLSGLPEEQRKPFRVFCRNNNASLPSKLDIELSGLSISRDFFCGVWTIKAVSGANLISTEDLQ